MASTTKTVIMEAPAAQIFKVLVNYEEYADFMEGVTKVEEISRDGSNAKVKYSINLIKKLSYVLDLAEEESKSVSWSFDEGDLFSINKGHWKLNDLGDGTTEVEYHVEVDLKKKMIGSGMIVKTLTEVQLPAMLKAVEERAQALG